MIFSAIPTALRLRSCASSLLFGGSKRILPREKTQKVADMIQSTNDILDILRAHKAELTQRFGVVSIGLFGSYARGQAQENSDIDIAVELLPERKTLANFFGVRRYLEQHFGKTVDLGIESTLKPLARETVASDILYV